MGPVGLAARALLLDERTWIAGGALWIERGVVRRVLATPGAVSRARKRAAAWIDVGEAVLAPGLVNGHAHLELGALAGRVPPGPDFAAWIRGVVAARADLARRELARGVRAGLVELRATGTTAVGDVDSTGTSTRLARALGLRGVVYRELLDLWDPARRRAALAEARGPARLGLARAGLSPHAPYTVSDELLRAAGLRARRRALPLAIHWSETRAELRWSRDGSGPLAELLPPSPRRAGLARLDAAGLLTPHTALIHGNHPGRGEPELLARRGVTLVHCPGAHAFFGREPFPLARYRAAGVPVALGTDSLAGNAALDLRREMALLRAAFPRLAAAEVYAMATRAGARALARADLGHARPGAAADLVAWRLEARGLDEALDELTRARPAVLATFLAGRKLPRPRMPH
ncbi:MAG TPA: amidohydrolase family protein [Planctomycetota bacterium]